jgi:hypothetical protein
MRCLGDDDVVRDATIEQVSQAVFTASPLGALGDYISEPTKLNAVSQERVNVELVSSQQCAKNTKSVNELVSDSELASERI